MSVEVKEGVPYKEQPTCEGTIRIRDDCPRVHAFTVRPRQIDVSNTELPTLLVTIGWHVRKAN